jgi:outer membrane protein OmpA-like peptidoglycan-associated protein/ABC-type nitrate/sulfonate/bicarbonate transport system substrate-binding protein
MNSNVKAFIAILTIGVLLLIGGYFARNWFAERAERSASDAGGVTKTLRIGMDNWVGYLPLCSKELRTRMHGAGFRVQCNDDSADYAARMKRLRQGELEFAVTTVDAFLLHGGKEKFPGSIIMVIDESSGGDALVARKDRLASLDELKTKTGYRIAFTAGSPSEHLLKSVAVHFDVPPLRDRQGAWRVGVKDSAEALKLLRERKVDAAVLWEPDVSRALSEAGVHRILGTENTRRLIVDVLLVNREFSRANPDAVKLLLSHYFRVLKHFRDKPDSLAAEVKAATRMSDQQVAAMLKGVRWTTLAENGRDWFGVGTSGRAGTESLIDTLEATAQILLDSGDFRENPIPERDPYLLQHRLYVEQLYTSGLGGADTAGAEQRGPRSFAALSDAQWDKLTEVGTLKIRPITFQSGTSDLSQDGKVQLDSAAQNLAHYPNFRVIVRGHTGTRGDAASNRELSLERADAVKRYLMVTHNIDDARLRAVGYGGERPLKQGEGESARAYQYRLPRVELFLASEAY